MVNPREEEPELGLDANVFQRLERIERSLFGRALHDPVEEDVEEDPNAVQENERVTDGVTPNATPVTNSENPPVASTVPTTVVGE